MKVAIIVSEKDVAGLNIKDCLLKEYDFKEKDIFDKKHFYEFENISLYTVEKESIFNENIDKEIEADMFIFATRHQSKEGVKTLSVHCPGNWTKAEFGGEDKKLCTAVANWMKTAFLRLKENSTKTDSIVSMECTHHGPFLEKPVMFIEIGSSLKQWEDKELGRIIAKTIIETVQGKILQDKVVFGIGGPHYCNNFNKVLERTSFAVGHVCPKYQLQNLDKKMIKQAIEKNNEKVEFILLDWKGLGAEKGRIVEMIKELGLRYKRTDQLL